MTCLFSLNLGTTVAFVGPSGAGKTTICSLIPRFYDVEAGAITVDGIDIRDMTKESLRANIGIVQQDVFLFTGTLRENIAYGRLGASQEDIEEAVRKAHLTELIASLARWLRYSDRREGPEAFRRPEAKIGDCADVPERSGNTDSG